MKPEESENLLRIDLCRLKAEGELFEGEVDIIDCEEEYVHPFGGVRYSLFAKVIASELLVKGRLEQDFDLVCVRCGADFDMTCKVEDFIESYEINDKTEFVDLTNDARDSIILNLPTYPVCSETCPGVVMKSENFSDDRWNVLDDLKKEEGDK
ncbi:MAG: hypothetical protein J6S51_01430 [Kiritimatiellae bacterium]|nr:hypothetical protein [Kiritimatiellia bacterium]